MMQITYVSDSFVTSRLMSIYRAIVASNKFKALALVKDTLHVMQYAIECDINMETRHIIVNNLYRAFFELAMGRLTEAHNYIRDTFYHIEAQYIPDIIPGCSTMQDVFA